MSDAVTAQQSMAVKVIYSGRYIPDLGIVLGPENYTGFIGWLVYKHPDGQWVTLVDLKEHGLKEK